LYRAAAGIVLLTLIAYLPALRAGWIWDDDYYVTNNVNLRSAGGLGNIWTKFGLSEGGTPQYYPVTHTTFWIEHQLWGLRPGGYHLVNILLHATNAVLLWLILRRLDVPGAWVAAAIFAVHPVHVESVAWVTERKNVLSGLFYLSALYLYLPLAGFANQQLRIRDPRFRYAIVLVLFVLALLSKSVTASLPAAILLIIWWKRGQIVWCDVLPLIPMFALGIAMGLFTSYMERTHVGAQGAEWNLSIADRFLIAGRAAWFYAMKLIAPVRLSFIYPRWEIQPSQAWQWIFPLAGVALVATAWALRNRVGRALLVAILFFGGTLLPALGFVNLLPMRYSFVADHFQYLASIGLIVLIVAAIAARLRDRGKPIAVAVLIVLGVMTFRRTFVYEDLHTLWADTIERNPTGWMPRTNLAKLLTQEGKFDAAQVQLAEAYRHNPEQAEVLNNLGFLAERGGRTDEAIALYRRVADRPEIHASVRALALTNLGRLMDVRGNADEAKRLYEQTVAVAPKYAPAHLLLGVALAKRGDMPAARQSFRRAAELDPASPDAWNNLGVASEQLGDVPGAVDAYQRALRADPSYDKARRNLDRLRLVR
jgi:tetratricopeptide (TPR) repeat protein